MLSIILTAICVVSGPKDGRKLVFDEEFNKAGSVNTAQWIFDDGPVYNQELEKYTSAKGGNAIVEHGNLVITATKVNGVITSARLETKQAWKYGYFEFRAKVPTGKGTWPAIWMLNESLKKGTGTWPASGEIDIMENVGYDPASFHFSLHSAKYNWMKPAQRTKAVSIPKATTEFHVFGLDWKPDTIVFYLDGSPAYTVERKGEDTDGWPFKDPFYLILNLAIGGNWGGSKGVDDAIFPSKYYIDYVRIYQ